VLRKTQGKGQPTVMDGPEGPFRKAGTPTIGRIAIAAHADPTLALARLDKPVVWMVRLVTNGFLPRSVLRMIYAKVRQADGRRCFEAGCACCCGFYIAGSAALLGGAVHPEELQISCWALPVFKNTLIKPGIFFGPSRSLT